MGVFDNKKIPKANKIYDLSLDKSFISHSKNCRNQRALKRNSFIKESSYDCL